MPARLTLPSVPVLASRSFLDSLIHLQQPPTRSSCPDEGWGDASQHLCSWKHAITPSSPSLVSFLRGWSVCIWLLFYFCVRYHVLNADVGR